MECFGPGASAKSCRILGFGLGGEKHFLFSLAVGVSRLRVDHQKCENEQSSVLCSSSIALPRSRQRHPQPGWTLNHHPPLPPRHSPLSSSLSPSLSLFLFLPTVILEKPIRIPRSLSVKAASVLKGFLNKVRAIHSQQALRVAPFNGNTRYNFGLHGALGRCRCRCKLQPKAKIMSCC